MRRTKLVLLITGVGALVAASFAVAAFRGHPQTSDVSATFTANQTRARTHTCTEGGNTFRVTNAVWRGTAVSTEPRLAGNLVLRTHAVLNQTTGDGWLFGSWRSRNPAGGAAAANLSAVIDNATHLDGLAAGSARNPYARLLGNWSATVAGEAISGNLGVNAPAVPDNSALLFRGGCRHGD